MHWFQVDSGDAWWINKKPFFVNVWGFWCSLCKFFRILSRNVNCRGSLFRPTMCADGIVRRSDVLAHVTLLGLLSLLHTCKFWWFGLRGEAQLRQCTPHMRRQHLGCWWCWHAPTPPAQERFNRAPPISHAWLPRTLARSCAHPRLVTSSIA